MSTAEHPPAEDWSKATRPLYYALGVWLVLTALLVWLDHYAHGITPAPAVVLHRMVELAMPCLPMLLGPAVLLAILYGLTGRAWSMAIGFGLRIGSVIVSLLAVFFAGVALFAVLIDGADHWEALPWITPPYLADFLDRHRGYEVVTYDGTRTVTVYDGKGHRALLNGDDLVEATLRFEPCPTGVSPGQLGGLPIPPQSKCATRLRVSNPRRELIEYAFDVDPGITYDQLSSHYTGWARQEGADSSLSGYRDYRFHAHKDGRDWDLWFRYGRNLETQVYIPQGGHTPPLPAADVQDDEPLAPDDDALPRPAGTPEKTAS